MLQMATDMFCVSTQIIVMPSRSFLVNCKRVCNKNNTTGAIIEQKLLTIPNHLRSPTVLSAWCLCMYCSIYVVFWRSLFVLLSFLAHLAKGDVSFYHHLASVVRRLSSISFSHVIVCPFVLFSSPCQRRCELLPSLGVRRPSSVVH